VAQVEYHPVLTEAEAEAVRQRLAQNPTDPVAPTEAWDFTAETSPHNYVLHSEDMSQYVNQATVTTDTNTAPDGSTTADTVEDTSTGTNNMQNFSELELQPGQRATAVLWIKKQSSVDYTARLSMSEKDTFADSTVGFNSETGEVIIDQDQTSDGLKYNVVDYSSNYWKLLISHPHDGTTAAELAWRFWPAGGDLNGNLDGSKTGAQVIWGAHLVLGDVADNPPPYAPTNGSIAYPQTVPALRDSTNDLTLGSETNNNGEPIADSADPSWVAPIGLIGDGADDVLDAPVFHNNHKATWITRMEHLSGERSHFRMETKAGWSLRFTNNELKLLAQDISGIRVGAVTSGLSLPTGEFHVVSAVIDRTEGKIKGYVNNQKTPVLEIDISGLDELPEQASTLWRWNISDVYRASHAHVYTRALSDEEALQARQAIIDNPEDPFPMQPDLIERPNLTQPTIDSATLNNDDTLTLNYS
jgi:hypothetical protein